jgi:DNA-binding transcriptional MerR regulator
MQIGDFSKLSFVTVKTLRYYDEIGLLKPERIDEFTGYRYYSASQLPRLNRILALKNMGLSLEEVARLLKDDVSVSHILDLLHIKQAEIKERLGREAEQLARVEQWLTETQKEGKMALFEVVIKKIKPQKVLSIRRVVPSYKDISSLFNVIGPYLGHVHAPVKGAPFAIYHDHEFKDSDVDVEVAFPLWKSVNTTGEFKSYELPGCDAAASLMYKGPFEGMSEPYNALGKWIESNGYHISGETREVYMSDPAKTKPEDYVTEILMPVAKNT